MCHVVAPRVWSTIAGCSGDGCSGCSGSSYGVAREVSARCVGSSDRFVAAGMFDQQAARAGWSGKTNKNTRVVAGEDHDGLLSEHPVAETRSIPERHS